MKKFEVHAECAVLLQTKKVTVEARDEQEAAQEAKKHIGRYDSIKRVVEVTDGTQQDHAEA